MARISVVNKGILPEFKVREYEDSTGIIFDFQGRIGKSKT